MGGRQHQVGRGASSCVSCPPLCLPIQGCQGPVTGGDRCRGLGPGLGGRQHQVGLVLCLTSSSVPTHPASNPSPARQDARRPRSRNPSTWTVEDVVWFVKDADPQALGPHVELFRKHVGAGWGPGLGGGRAGAAGGGGGSRVLGAPLAEASHLVWLLGGELCPIYSSVLAFTSSACRHVVLKLFRRFRNKDGQ